AIYDIHSANAAGRLDQLASYGGVGTGKLLLVGGDDVLEREACRRGYEVTRLTASEFEDSGTLGWAENQFEASILFSSLQTMKDPLAALVSVRRLLKPDGTLMTICPALDSRTARLFRSSWWEFSKGN